MKNTRNDLTTNTMEIKQLPTYVFAGGEDVEISPLRIEEIAAIVETAISNLLIRLLAAGTHEKQIELTIEISELRQKFKHAVKSCDN